MGLLAVSPLRLVRFHPHLPRPLAKLADQRKSYRTFEGLHGRRLRLIARLAYADAAIIFLGALLLAIPNAAQPFFGYVMVPLGILASLVIGVIFQALSQVAAQATGLRDESELTI